jgi:hypothetical protein
MPGVTLKKAATAASGAACCSLMITTMPFFKTNLETFPACSRPTTDVEAGTSIGAGGGAVGDDSGVGTLGRPRPLWAADVTGIDKIELRTSETEQMPRVACNVLLLCAALKMIDALNPQSQSACALSHCPPDSEAMLGDEFWVMSSE